MACWPSFWGVLASPLGRKTYRTGVQHRGAARLSALPNAQTATRFIANRLAQCGRTYGQRSSRHKSRRSNCLDSVGDVPADQLQSFAEEMQRALNSRELIVSRDLRKTSTCANQLLLLAPGVITRTQLSQLKQELALQDGPIAGWVFLDPVLKLS